MFTIGATYLLGDLEAGTELFDGSEWFTLTGHQNGSSQVMGADTQVEWKASSTTVQAVENVDDHTAGAFCMVIG